jgi:hypothetical protein
MKDLDDTTRFNECAAAYGHRRDRWPAADQPLYDRHAASDWGQSILADAEAIDQFLDGNHELAPAEPAWLAQLEDIADAPPTPRLSRRAKALIGASLALVATVGFVQGAVGEWKHAPGLDDEAILASMLAATTRAS